MDWGALRVVIVRVARALSSLDLKKRPEPPAFAPDANVAYASDGRAGSVYFSSRSKQFRMYYEFGGGKTLALIFVPTERQWTEETGFPLEQRAEILNFVARTVVADQTTTGRNRFEVGDDCITIFAS